MILGGDVFRMGEWLRGRRKWLRGRRKWLRGRRRGMPAVSGHAFVRCVQPGRNVLDDTLKNE